MFPLDLAVLQRHSFESVNLFDFFLYRTSSQNTYLKRLKHWRKILTREFQTFWDTLRDSMRKFSARRDSRYLLWNLHQRTFYNVPRTNNAVDRWHSLSKSWLECFTFPNQNKSWILEYSILLFLRNIPWFLHITSEDEGRKSFMENKGHIRLIQYFEENACICYIEENIINIIYLLGILYKFQRFIVKK